MSNTGENAELIELLRDKSEDGTFCDFERHLFLKSAQAIAAAEARIGELELEVSALEQSDREWSARAETAETLLEEARRALEPFIRLADNVFSDGKNATVADEVTLWCFNDTDITFGDLRRARATLDRIGK